MNTITNNMFSRRISGSSALLALFLGVFTAFVMGFSAPQTVEAQWSFDGYDSYNNTYQAYGYDSGFYSDGYCSGCNSWSFDGYDSYSNTYQPYTSDAWYFDGYDSYNNTYQPYTSDSWSFDGYDSYNNTYQAYSGDSGFYTDGYCSGCDEWAFDGYDSYFNTYQPYVYDNGYSDPVYYEPYYSEAPYVYEPYPYYYYEPYYYEDYYYYTPPVYYPPVYEPPTYYPPHDDQPVCDISADDRSIEKGESTRLTWDSDDAHSARLNQGIGSVSLNGSRTVSPRVDTTYVLTVEDNDGDRDTCSVTINVEEEEDDLVCDIDAEDTSIEDGDSTRIRWNPRGADDARINQGIGSVDEDGGSRTVSPSRDTTYTLTVENNDGDRDTCSVTIRVDEEDDDLWCRLSASPSSIDDGERVRFTWDTRGDVRDARINNGVGSVDEDGGSEYVYPDRDTRYTLTIEDRDGDEETCSATVDVDDGLAPPPDVPLVYLSQLPYTGIEDNLTYWMLLIVGSGLLGYALFFRIVPFALVRVSPVFATDTEKDGDVTVPTTPQNVTRQDVRAFVSALSAGDIASAKEFADTFGAPLLAETAVVLDDVARARREGTTADPAVSSMTGDWDGVKMDAIVSALVEGNVEETLQTVHA